MTEIWMFTAPAEPGKIRGITDAYQIWGGKKYQIGLEKGRGGYRHLQGRIQFAGNLDVEIPKTRGKKKEKTNLFFELCKRSGIHAEKSENWCDYEGKDGCYITSEDCQEIRSQRFGRPTATQEDIVGLTEWTNDREVMVWHDPEGNQGKSWITGHLWEKGKAHYIRMTGLSAESIIKDTASKMSKQRRPMVIIDIPRATKWKNGLYEAVEVIKDGLIDDPRYTSQAINIKGVKVLVMCNTRPDPDKLSEDRWIIYGEKLPSALQARHSAHKRLRAEEDRPGGSLS